MALSAAQLSLCLQSYWYIWVINGISGLLFLGIEIGIAAFFLKKFGNRKSSNDYLTTTRRHFNLTEVNSFDDLYADSITEQYDSRNTSAESGKEPGILEDNDEFAQSTLQALNSARHRYNSPPLELNDQLSEIAQRWADQMARTGKLEHSPAEWRNFGRQILGENYIALFQVELTGNKMVKKWMKEEKRYMFGFDGRKDTENFTQLVWRASQEIGVGRARSEDGNWWYGVVVFDPPGNIPNQYANNVFLPPA